MSALAFPKPVKRGPRPRARIRTKRPVGTKRREAKAAGYVDPLTWIEVVRFYGGLCAYCEERPWQDPDHVYPVAKGGPDVIENLVPCCRPCNLEKGTSTHWQPKRVHPYVTLIRNKEA